MTVAERCYFWKIIIGGINMAKLIVLTYTFKMTEHKLKTILTY